MQNLFGAVITGDIEHSTQLNPQDRSAMLPTLQRALALPANWQPYWQSNIFQGDSFQGYTLQKPQDALGVALWIWLHLKSQHLAARIAIALGTVSLNTGSTLTSDGEAFRLSGRLLGTLKQQNQLLGIQAGNLEFNAEWQVHSLTADYLMQRTSPLQAEAMQSQLSGLTQQQAAAALGTSQPLHSGYKLQHGPCGRLY